MTWKSMKRWKVSLTPLPTTNCIILTQMTCRVRKSPGAGSVGIQWQQALIPFSQHANAQDLSGISTLNALEDGSMSKSKWKIVLLSNPFTGSLLSAKFVRKLIHLSFAQNAHLQEMVIKPIIWLIILVPVAITWCWRVSTRKRIHQELFTSSFQVRIRTPSSSVVDMRVIWESMTFLFLGAMPSLNSRRIKTSQILPQPLSNSTLKIICQSSAH